MSRIWRLVSLPRKLSGFPFLLSSFRFPLSAFKLFLVLVLVIVFRSLGTWHVALGT